MTVEFYIILQMETLTLSHFLSPLCWCHCRFKRYIAKETNSKSEETGPLWRQPAFPITCLLSFSFSFDVASHKLHDSFFFYFFLSVFLSLIFSFFENYNRKRQRSHLLFFLSLFSSFFYFVLSFSFSFFLSLKITTKTSKISPFFLSFFLSVVILAN